MGPKLEAMTYYGVIEQPSLPQSGREREQKVSNLLNAVPGLQHHHTVPPDHHHPNLVLRFLLGELNRVVQHQVHEGVKTTESAFHLASPIDPEVNPLVHELLELRGVCLRHLSFLTVDSLVEVNQAIK